ncbi:MAG TPA: NUDIX domain-containing protein [Acidimicrobiales bacterium]|nr:NUDIX domain-containing protein [Acidimicrobiales bacterium]
MTGPGGGARIRLSVRALVLDERDRVLLMRFELPGRTIWATPGGGIEAGEDATTALRRELDEELGLAPDELGPRVWTRLAMVPLFDGAYDGQREDFRLVRTAAFTPEPRLGWDGLRAEGVHEIRWWTADELADAGDVTFAPRRLPALLAELLAGGVPDEPVDTGE